MVFRGFLFRETFVAFSKYNNFCKNGKRAARCTADNFYTKSARQKPAASVQDTGSRTYSARTGVAGFGRSAAGKAAAYWKSTARCTAIKHEKAHRPFHERRACGCYSPKSCFFFASKSFCVIRPSSSSALKRRSSAAVSSISGMAGRLSSASSSPSCLNQRRNCCNSLSLPKCSQYSLPASSAGRKKRRTRKAARAAGGTAGAAPGRSCAMAVYRR